MFPHPELGDPSALPPGRLPMGAPSLRSPTRTPDLPVPGSWGSDPKTLGSRLCSRLRGRLVPAHPLRTRPCRAACARSDSPRAIPECVRSCSAVRRLHWRVESPRRRLAPPPGFGCKYLSIPAPQPFEGRAGVGASPPDTPYKGTRSRSAGPKSSPVCVRSEGAGVGAPPRRSPKRPPWWLSPPAVRLPTHP